MTGAPLAVAYPEDAARAELRLLVLPHPHTGVPAYFGAPPEGDRLYELLVVRPEGRVARSLFLAPSEGHGPGYVVADGSVRILTQVDPAFVMLGILAEERGLPRRFCPLDDMVDEATERHAHRRAAELAALHADQVRATGWPDIPELFRLPGMARHLQRICTTQAEPSAADGLVYCIDMERVYTLLSDKVQRLLATHVWDEAPETLGRQARRRVAATASDAEWNAARRDVAEELVASYVSAPIAASCRAACRERTTV